jgi:hypothetical protein
VLKAAFRFQFLVPISIQQRRTARGCAFISLVLK